MPPPAPPIQCDVAYITAGAAGMYCGSCMQDNTLVKALRAQGMQALLIPTYTPIRTDDEDDASESHVFFGGINIYLQQHSRSFRWIPSILTSWLNRPGLLRWATSRGISISAQELGALTVSMLAGSQGHQRSEVERLCRWLKRHAAPQTVHLTNLLIGGCIPDLKQQLSCSIVVTLQGDDIFLQALPEPYRSEALQRMRALATHVDAFICYSQRYADIMADALEIPMERMHVVPLGIDHTAYKPAADFSGRPHDRSRRIGYLARLAPEKGLHVLIDAFVDLKQRPGMDDVELHIAGWQGSDQISYARAQQAKIESSALSGVTHWHGSIDGRQKREFLEQLTLFSVPATFEEPKGIYALEAISSGVPVVLPRIGAFPEIIAATGGGTLVRPVAPTALAAEWFNQLSDPRRLHKMSVEGATAAREHYSLDTMSQAVLTVYAHLASHSTPDGSLP